jgi:integrase
LEKEGGQIMKVNTRKRGNVYEYYFEVAKVDGKRKQISKCGYKSKKIAEIEGNKAMNNLFSGIAYEPCKISYSDFLDMWLEKWVYINLKYRTIETYESIIKIHLKPNIGFYTLEQLTPKVLNDFMTDLYVKHSYSRWYMRGILKIIKGSLRFACDDMNLIPVNPALKVHIPKYDTAPSDPAHIFTKEEINRIFDRFKTSHSIYYSLITAYYTGMRKSEIFGLTWDNIDFKNKTITINKNIVERNQKGCSHQRHVPGSTTCVWYFGTCKTQSSYRTITIGDTLLEILKKYKQEQEDDKKLYGDSYIMHYKKEVKNPYTNKPEIKIISASKEIPISCPVADLVFVKNNGYFLGTGTIKYAMKVIHYELGIKSRFHDFRDTHATRLIESGSDIKAVSKRLGHSNINTTYNIYVKVTNKMEQETANTFEKYADLKLDNKERSTNEEL